MEPRGERGGSRAQLIIITALVLATVFVALALVLNSGIYSENLSTRETTDSEAAVGYAQEAEVAVADAYGIANGAGASTTDAASDAFADVLDSWADARSREAAKNGVSADIDRELHLGWRLEQDEDRSFTPVDDTGTTEWSVVKDVDRIGTFEMDVTRESLFDADESASEIRDEAFRLYAVDDDENEWEMYVFKDGSTDDVIVYVGDPDGSDISDLLADEGACDPVESNRAVIDLKKGTVDGKGCNALTFAEGLSGSVDVHFENVRDASDGASRVDGKYNIVVNNSDAVTTDVDGHPEHFNEPSGDAPTAQAVVYSVTYSTQYERSDVRFTRDGRYAVREETYAG